MARDKLRSRLSRKKGVIKDPQLFHPRRVKRWLLEPIISILSQFYERLNWEHILWAAHPVPSKKGKPLNLLLQNPFHLKINGLDSSPPRLWPTHELWAMAGHWKWSTWAAAVAADLWPLIGRPPPDAGHWLVQRSWPDLRDIARPVLRETRPVKDTGVRCEIWETWTFLTFSSYMFCFQKAQQKGLNDSPLKAFTDVENRWCNLSQEAEVSSSEQHSVIWLPVDIHGLSPIIVTIIHFA